VQKKIVEQKVAEDAATAKEDSFKPEDYPMVHFAEKYFNDPELVHPQKGSTLKRSGKMPTMEKAQMCFYTEATTISTSMLHLHNPMNVATAVGLWVTCRDLIDIPWHS
jgi:hypothetical protein